ncbi:MAG: hypothetical protein ACKOHM_05080 [Spartobacteria bacterium]
MKSLAITLLVATALVAIQSGCERHPASETVPGYAEKMSKKEAQAGQQATHSEPVDPKAPTYFPPKN